MKTIVLATDGSDTAAAATATAIDLAAAQDAKLVVVAAWDLAFIPLGYGPVVPDLDRIEEDEAKRVTEAVAEQARASGVRAEAIIRRGFPVEQICRLAEERYAAMIVLGTHGRGPLRRMVFGSVSTGVLHHAKCPVLVVPPSDHSGSGASDHAVVGGGERG
jgi:nucleotide-binding universal stress UspA family protein